MLSTILLALFLSNNSTGNETKSVSIPVVGTNFLEDMPECAQQLRQRKTQCEIKFNILDNYIIDLRREN
jgi:hypothetical protein